MPDAQFSERYRPQFHYSAATGWINDPIGLVCYEGEYHLFNDHNPGKCTFPNGIMDGDQSHWSHAISPDLIHWEHQPIAVYPDALGACWSGSGVVDWNNTTGFQTGDEPPLVLIYASAGGSFTQSLTYSNDRGRTWTTYDGNPVLNQLEDANRDPKVFWHEPTGRWVMVLYVIRGEAHFFTSPDLREWTLSSVVPLDDFFECPDLFQLPVDGDPANMKWVLHDAHLHYWIGEFDGETFVAETERRRGDFGRNFHAAQSWNDAPRRVQVGWMCNGEYPEMPFSQQMSFPCELSLATVGGEVRLCRNPIGGIEQLHGERFELMDVTLAPGDDLLAGQAGELLDIELVVRPRADAEFALAIGDKAVTCAGGEIACLDARMAAPLIDGALKLRVLVDRTSIEVFAADGAVVMSSCYLPANVESALSLRTTGGAVAFDLVRVTQLTSAWPASLG